MRDLKTKLKCFDIYNSYAEDIEKIKNTRFLMPRVIPSTDAQYLNGMIDELISSQKFAKSFVIDIGFMAKIISDNDYCKFLSKLNEVNSNIILHANGYFSSFNFKYPYIAKTSMSCVNAMELLQDAYMRKIFDQHTNLKFIFSEVGYKWIDYLAEKIEFYTKRYQFLEKLDKPNIPLGEVLKKNIFYTFTNDLPINLNLVHCSYENLLYGTDFPHADSTYLLSQGYLNRFQLADQKLANAVFIENGKRVFEFY